jgi:hypothetical protein
METVTTSLITFVALFGGTLLGMFLGSRLPEHHLSEDSKRIVNLGAGIIGTMAALVLGLLVASAKGNYDTRNNEVLDATAKIALLDRILAQYGPDSRPTRERLQQSVERATDRLWPDERSASGHLGNDSQGIDTVLDLIEDLPAANEVQRTIKAQALSIAMNVAQTRWLMYAQQESSVSRPLVVIVRPVCTAQCDGYRHLVLVRNCCLSCGFPDTGNVQPVWRLDTNLQCPNSKRDCADG